MPTPMPTDRLTMPIGEAMFTQRSTRKLRPDPIPVEDLHLIMEAAVKAPNGGNQQIARFLVVDDRTQVRDFAALYHEAWWAKRHDEGFRPAGVANRDDLPRAGRRRRVAGAGEPAGDQAP